MEISPYHPFRSDKAKTEYLEFYDMMAQKWPVTSDCKTVNTSFGQTFVRISGPAGAAPLVLLPGIGNNSLMWLSNVEAFSESYKVYAVDNIYDYGRSVYTRVIKDADDFTDWLDELFNALEPEADINIIGASYGAWLTCLYALRFPNRINKIVLLAPAGTVLPLSFGFIWRGALCLLPYRYFLKSMMYWIAEDLVKKGDAGRISLEEMVDFAFLGTRNFKKKRLVNPTILNDDELQEIRVPALYLVGENEKNFSARKAVKRLNEIAPQIKTEIIPNAGHDLFWVQADMVNRKILEFLNN